MRDDEVKHLRTKADIREWRESEDLTLLMITKWRIARAKQEIAWAEYDLATGYSTKESTAHPYPNNECLDKMRLCEAMLEREVPKSVLIAQEMLKMAIEILGRREIDPGHAFSKGDVRRLISNVLSGLGWLDSLTHLGAIEQPSQLLSLPRSTATRTT